ncbi:rab9 effector protein with kelch motifs-like [Tubulanus polymorphus]|uniref:rab9 effector protein with kelch motifs-like n=1 Tax=Tubulanus polymorphus TaxID=672921 RepID=UPI003DA3AA6F
MELHAMLERGTNPNAGLWYVVSAIGDCPTMRVGHTCTHIPDVDGATNGKVYVIGGANPDGPFNDVRILDLETLSWDICDAQGFTARYEHCAFTPDCDPRKIYVFGGAQQTGNVTNMQVYDTEERKWETVKLKGTWPSPRTFHTVAANGNKLYVYSGGENGAEPVKDRKVYRFDAETRVWDVLSVRGDSPKPRHGHAMAVVRDKLIVHGGMSGPTFYDDLHFLDLEKLTWNSVKQKRNYPSARAAHSAIVMDTRLYICGGMGLSGALDDTYCLDTETMKWRKVEQHGPPPECRLDFASCVVKLTVPINNDDSSNVTDDVLTTRKVADVLENEMNSLDINNVTNLNESNDIERAKNDNVLAVSATSAESSDRLSISSTEGSTSHSLGVKTETTETKTIHMLLIHGGMDTHGTIFYDTLATLIE